MPPPPVEYKDLVVVDKLDLFLFPAVFLFLSEVTGNLAPVNLSATDWSHLELHRIAQELHLASSSLQIKGIELSCPVSGEFHHSLC
jgi:hypothetical protein